MTARWGFLARLPSRTLLPVETELREALTRSATLAGEFLPKDVSLQDWVECRMPGEIQLGCDAAHRVTLRPPEVSRASISKDTALFLKALPVGDFHRDEDRLRDALLERLTITPVLVGQLALDRQIANISSDFLPSYVHLADWIEWRIGKEVAVFTDEQGQRVAKLGLQPGTPPTPTGSRAQRLDTHTQTPTFAPLPTYATPPTPTFAPLPTDSFTEDEERLRNALFDFFASWQHMELPTLRDISSDRDVKQAKDALSPQVVHIHEWIGRRLGEELELTQDDKGQTVVDLRIAARQRVRERYEAMRFGEKRFHEKRGEDEKRDWRFEDKRDRRFEEKGHWRFEERALPPDEARRKFFAKLPPNKFTEVEQDLRDKLVDFINEWDSNHSDGPEPHISDVNEMGHIRSLKEALLPRGVSFKEWIDRRCKEIQVKNHGEGQYMLHVTGKKKASMCRTDEEREALQWMRDAFFESLPSDGFTPEEEDFREAVLAFVDRHPRRGPAPELHWFTADQANRAVRQALLPKSCGVSMQVWIDRRMGEELETRSVPPGVTQVAYRGQLDSYKPRDAQPAKRKAPADEPGSWQWKEKRSRR